jgi:hypothetical protein
MAPFLADATTASTGFTLRSKRRFRFEQSSVYYRLGMRQDSSLFDNYILRTKLNYQFTRALSLRGILDYKSVLANPRVVASGSSKQVAGDVLATYLVNPGTAIYVGYSSRYDNLALIPGLGYLRSGAPALLTQRQFFLKLSYLFRY